VIPFGDFCQKRKAEDIIRANVPDYKMRRKMLRLVALIPEKKSLLLAQKAMNCRDVDRIMEEFARINLSPVTISKRQEEKCLENFYSFLLD
jgi:flagellar biosynthesis GTPase FlhF